MKALNGRLHHVVLGEFGLSWAGDSLKNATREGRWTPLKRRAGRTKKKIRRAGQETHFGRCRATKFDQGEALEVGVRYLSRRGTTRGGEMEKV